MIKAEVLTIGGEEVILDPEILKFSETSLNDYIKCEGGFYDNFGGYLARAERLLQFCESCYDDRYNQMFYQYKSDGGSDKLAEARAKIDPDVQNARQGAIEAKYLVNRLKNHLRAWDRNHDNAQSMGHMLRKEMERINFDIKSLEASTERHSYQANREKEANLYSRFAEIDDIVKPFGEE